MTIWYVLNYYIRNTLIVLLQLIIVFAVGAATLWALSSEQYWIRLQKSLLSDAAVAVAATRSV